MLNNKLSRKIIIFLAIAAIFLTACSSNGPELPESKSYSEDYEFLWETLETSYPYLLYLRDEMNIDVDEIHDRYETELASITDNAAFAGCIERMLAELKNFAHLNLISPEMYKTYYYIYVQSKVMQNEGFSEILQDSRLSDIYSSGDIPDDYQQQTAEHAPAVFIQYYDAYKAIYLKINTFDQEVFERDKNIVYDALEQYPDAENIIFDITENGGGSDYYWMNDLVAPFGGRYEFTHRIFFRSTKLLNYYYPDNNYRSVSELEDSPEWAVSLRLDSYFVNTWILPEENSSQPVIDKDIKKWVLTSEKVYSSADKFVCFCKATGWATIVGTSTSGDGLGSTPILVILPYSGLLVRFSCMAGENPDGGMNAAEGSYPDVICIKGEWPLNRCLELINEQH